MVDFGCGSGNLCLAFAAIFPDTKFVFCDMKEESLNILRKRAENARITNVFIFQRMFSPQNASEDVEALQKEYPEFDLGIGLHCCALHGLICIALVCCDET